jgi:hypothetical protein
MRGDDVARNGMVVQVLRREHGNTGVLLGDTVSAARLCREHSVSAPRSLGNYDRLTCCRKKQENNFHATNAASPPPATLSHGAVEAHQSTPDPGREFPTACPPPPAPREVNGQPCLTLVSGSRNAC